MTKKDDTVPVLFAIIALISTIALIDYFSYGPTSERIILLYTCDPTIALNEIEHTNCLEVIQKLGKLPED